MNVKTIVIKDYHDLQSLKRSILQDLKLIDFKKDSVSEFDQRLKSFLARNNTIKLEFKIHRDKINNDIKHKLTGQLQQSKIPDHYEFGNPHNRWVNDPAIKTPEELKQDDEIFRTQLEAEIAVLNDFLSSLEKISDGNIAVTYM